MKRPKQMGMRHLALRVSDLAACVHFYCDFLGMAIEWQPDDDNVYLSSGADNLALHRGETSLCSCQAQRLDHLGFICATAAEVDHWHDYAKAWGVTVCSLPKTHRDGARSFYCLDPDGNSVQIIHHPPISDQLSANSEGSAA